MKRLYLIALCLVLMLCVLSACRGGNVGESTADTQATTAPTQATTAPTQATTQASETMTLPLPTGNDPTGNTAASLPADPLPSLMG